MLSLFSVVPAVDGQPPAKKAKKADDSDTEDSEEDSESSEEEVEEKKKTFVKPAPTAKKPPAKAKVQLFLFSRNINMFLVPNGVGYDFSAHNTRFICLSHKPWTFPKSYRRYAELPPASTWSVCPL